MTWATFSSIDKIDTGLLCSFEQLGPDRFLRGDHICVATMNVNGGTSLLSSTRDNEMVVFDRPMAVGETVVFDDRAFKHYVTPFTPKMPGRPAYRDVIVLTVDQRRQDYRVLGTRTSRQLRLGGPAN